MNPLALTLAIATIPLAAGTLAQQEREFLVQHLENTKGKLLHAVKGLSESQMNFKPAPERWSVAECLEHLAASEQFLRQIGFDPAMKSPPSPERIAARKGGDAVIHQKTVPERSQKFQAPEPVRPTNRYGSPAGSLEAFLTKRDQLIAYVRETRDDLRAHASPHALVKEADGYQWLLFLSSHTERHTAQILEVKADSGFPRE